jgi:hypothetical protein
VARQEVIALRKQGLLGRPVQFDPVTDFYLLAWDAFRAATFPADEARKLALALGVDLESSLVRQHRVLAKRGDAVTLQEPRERRTRGRLDPEAETFPTWLDAVHTALLVVQEDGTRAARRFLDGHGLAGGATFKALVQGLIRAIPATRNREGRYLRPEAEALERLRQAVFPDLEPAPEEAPEPEQLAILEDDEEGGNE